MPCELSPGTTGGSVGGVVDKPLIPRQVGVVRGTVRIVGCAQVARLVGGALLRRFFLQRLQADHRHAGAGFVGQHVAAHLVRHVVPQLLALDGAFGSDALAADAFAVRPFAQP